MITVYKKTKFSLGILWSNPISSNSYNHKITIWVSHEDYLNPKLHKILSRAF